MPKLQPVLIAIFIGLCQVGFALEQDAHENVDGSRAKVESPGRAPNSQADPRQMVDSIDEANKRLRGLYDASAVGEKPSLTPSSPFEAMPTYPVPNR